MGLFTRDSSGLATSKRNRFHEIFQHFQWSLDMEESYRSDWFFWSDVFFNFQFVFELIYVERFEFVTVSSGKLNF